MYDEKTYEMALKVANNKEIHCALDIVNCQNCFFNQCGLTCCEAAKKYVEKYNNVV